MKYFLRAWPVMALGTVIFAIAAHVTHDVGCLYCARVCAWTDIGMIVWGLLLIASQSRGRHHRRG